jgi:putative ABC transport system permease protein
MTTLINDIKYAYRTLAKQPLFALLVIGILAIGITGSATMFSIFNAACLRPLPIPYPERVVKLDEWSGGVGISGLYTVFEDLRKHNTSFEAMAAFMGAGGNLLLKGQAESVSVMRTTHELFDIFGIKPLVGRCFTAEEDYPNASGVVVLGFDLWQRLFGGDKDILGKPLQLNDRIHRIIGVMPKEDTLLEDYDLWIPLAGNRDRHYLIVYGRLKSGITYKRAQQDLSRLSSKPIVDGMNDNDAKYRLIPIQTIYTGHYQTMTTLFLCAVNLVLLVACFNVSGLLLARSAYRSRELGIRAAMGATRRRIMQQVLTESLVLSILGAGLGMLLSRWILDAQIALLSTMIPRWASLALDGRYMAFCLCVVIGTTALSGILPAWHACENRHIHNILQSGGPVATAARGQRRSLHAVVASEIALALILLIGAGLLWQSFCKVQQVEPGYRTEDLLVYRLRMGSLRQGRDGRHAFYREHIERVRALPGVKNAALIYSLGGSADDRIVTEGGRQFATGQEPSVLWHLVWPGYMETMAVKLLAGRAFTEQDMHPGGDNTVVVNQSLADYYWPQKNPIGQRLRFIDDQDTWFRVVGITADVRYHGLDQPTQMGLYVPYNWKIWDKAIMEVVVHTSNSPASMTYPIQQIVKEADPTMPPPSISTISERISWELHRRHIFSLPFYIFAVVAAMLAIGGVYGVMSYAVSQKTQEIGIRIAIGAQQSDIIKQILSHGAHLIGFGLLFGIIGGLILSRVLSSALFGISAVDFVTYLAVSALLAATTLLACYIPARRAVKIDPMEALRYE